MFVVFVLMFFIKIVENGCCGLEIKHNSVSINKPSLTFR